MDFSGFVTQYELEIRLAFFFGIFLIMALWELAAPRRMLKLSKLARWANNLGLVVLNSVILRVLFPAAAVGMAVFVADNGWGLFNYFDVPQVVAVLVSFLLLDLLIYLQHVMVHAVPVLWRLHRVHHADMDFDLTTGARFHPLEIVLSMLIKFAGIALIGAPVVAVIVFEVVLNGTAMFNHSNVQIPRPIDRILRWFIVTPDMHRVHHSVEFDEANSNFCFNLPWWDRLFGTYREQPRAGHQGMTIGYDPSAERPVVSLTDMLIFPFTGETASYSINRTGKTVQHDKP